MNSKTFCRAIVILGLLGPVGWALPALAAASLAEDPATETETASTEAPAEEQRPTKVIKMYAENWKWTPKTIRVKQGTRVVLKFRSYDASHSFVLKKYGLKVPLPQDSTREAEFIADEPGTFRWKCGRPCGDGCPKMVGKLIVE